MPTAHNDVKHLLEQYNFILELVEQHTRPIPKRLVLTPNLIRKLHAMAYTGTSTGNGGKFRAISVAVSGSDHLPTAPADVAQEVALLCEYINTHWEQLSAIHLAAYALWKLNWIHPFVDGNGRTARALSYLILSTRLGTFLPGAPTIPEQLRHHRAQYFDALQAADVAFEQHGRVDVAKIETMLEGMLIQQLTRVPAIPDEVRDHVNDVINRRIRRASPATIRQIFGQGDVIGRPWAISDHLVLQVGSPASVQQAERTNTAQGNAFPRLLAVDDATAPIRVLESQRGIILREPAYDASSGYAVEFERNAAAVIENPRVCWTVPPEDLQTQWELKGALYVIRFGRQITVERAGDAFDFLVARHMMVLAA
jgi:Fic/DOC family